MLIGQKERNWFWIRRKRMKLSQAEMGAKCGVSGVSVSQWERNIAYPRTTTDGIDKIAIGYGVRVGKLIQVIMDLQKQLRTGEIVREDDK